MRIEILDGKTVTQTIIADEAFAEANYQGSWRIAEQHDEPSIPTVEPRRVTTLAFLSRFTDEEAVTIDLASLGATVQAASIRRYLSKVNAATYIDLAREDTVAGILALESSGLIPVGRSAAILEGEILPNERPVV